MIEVAIAESVQIPYFAGSQNLDFHLVRNFPHDRNQDTQRRRKGCCGAVLRGRLRRPKLAYSTRRLP